MLPIYLSVIRQSGLPCECVAGERGQEVEGGAGGAAGLAHQRDPGRVSACLSCINIRPAVAAGRD